jgi:chitinase
MRKEGCTRFYFLRESRKRSGSLLAIACTIAGVSLVAGISAMAQGKSSSLVVTGYVFTRNEALQPGQIAARKLTRINYAFANIEKGRVVLGAPVDAMNLAALVSLRRENPSLTILVSVGGWLGSGKFSDAALTAQNREAFVESAAALMKQYELDGLDVDWEYPGLAGAGNRFRAGDKENFTLLMKDLRARFDHESDKSGRKLYLTIAAGAFDEFIEHTEMNEVQRYVDTVNLMTYDFYEAGSDATTGHHAALYANSADPKKASADAAVRAFEKAGVPAEKILLGVPFYGRMWGEVANRNHGLFQPGKPVPNSYAPYSLIATTMVNGGFTRYWDSASSVPYLYNSEKHIFVSYEDTESLAAKCRYILGGKLGGVMFWEYSGDSSGELLDTINKALHVQTSVSPGK